MCHTSASAKMRYTILHVAPYIRGAYAVVVHFNVCIRQVYVAPHHKSHFQIVSWKNILGVRSIPETVREIQGNSTKCPGCLNLQGGMCENLARNLLLWSCKPHTVPSKGYYNVWKFWGSPTRLTLTTSKLCFFFGRA